MHIHLFFEKITKSRERFDPIRRFASSFRINMRVLRSCLNNYEEMCRVVELFTTKSESFTVSVSRLMDYTSIVIVQTKSAATNHLCPKRLCLKT